MCCVRAHARALDPLDGCDPDICDTDGGRRSQVCARVLRIPSLSAALIHGCASTCITRAGASARASVQEHVSAVASEILRRIRDPDLVAPPPGRRPAYNQLATLTVRVFQLRTLNALCSHSTRLVPQASAENAVLALHRDEDALRLALETQKAALEEERSQLKEYRAQAAAALSQHQALHRSRLHPLLRTEPQGSVVVDPASYGCTRGATTEAVVDSVGHVRALRALTQRLAGMDTRLGPAAALAAAVHTAADQLQDCIG